METIYFLVFIGVCAFAVVWATRRSKKQTDLAAKRKTSRPASEEKLARPLDNRLSHREQIWDARRTRTSKGYTEHQTFVPKSESRGFEEYDGYSRRDRHHVTPSSRLKESKRADEEHGMTMTAMKFEDGEFPSRTKHA